MNRLMLESIARSYGNNAISTITCHINFISQIITKSNNEDIQVPYDTIVHTSHSSPSHSHSHDILHPHPNHIMSRFQSISPHRISKRIQNTSKLR